MKGEKHLPIINTPRQSLAIPGHQLRCTVPIDLWPFSSGATILCWVRGEINIPSATLCKRNTLPLTVTLESGRRCLFQEDAWLSNATASTLMLLGA